MLNTFILGINEGIDGSYHMGTSEVYNQTGQNIGNLSFHYAMARILAGQQQSLPWHTPPDLINQTGRIGVMPCANQLGPHSDYRRLGENFSRLTIPLVAVGLGAQGNSRLDQVPEVPEGTLNWVKEIALHAPTREPNIGVRGPFTLRVMQHYGLGDKAIVTGCPTLFINPSRYLGAEIEERAKNPVRRIAVASGHQRWKHLSKIEASLAKLVESTGGAYVAQSPLEMVALARGDSDSIAREDLEACRDYTCPHLDIETFKIWSQRFGRVFMNVSEWMEQLRSFDFVVGARIHGVMLGLQAGVPSLCIAHDSRTREMCETMHVPFVMSDSVIDGLSLTDLSRHFIFDGRAFDANRAMLARRLSNFLSANRIGTSPWFGKICDCEPKTNNS